MPTLFLIFIFAFWQQFCFGSIVKPAIGPTESSHQVVLDKWTLLDQSMRNVMNGGFANWFYEVLEKKPESLGVSKNCAGTLSEMTEGLRLLKKWPIQMLDATGRIPSGLISGTTADLGNFDQCLDIQVMDETTQTPKLQGQYCMLNIRPTLPTKPKILTVYDTIVPLSNITTENYLLDEIRKFAPKYYDIPISVGVCVPSTCSKMDLNKIATHLSSQVGLTSVIHRCEVKENWRIDGLQASIICFFGLLVLLCIVGTIIDDEGDEINSKTHSTSPFQRILHSFSVKRNFRRLGTVNTKDENELAFLHGLRFYTVNWVLLGHSYLMNNYEAMQSSKNIRGFMESPPFQFVNGGGIGVDSFILISCFLVTYLGLKKTDQDGPQVFNVFKIIFHRIFRLLPPWMLAMGVMILLPLAGSGPMFHENIDLQVKNCRENWWYNALFINNMLHPSKMCLIHTWFIAVDFHVFILSVGFMFIALRNMKLAMILSVLLTIATVAVTFGINYWRNLGPYFTFNNLNLDGLSEFLYVCHTQTHAHIGAGCIGMILGVHLARRKREVPHTTIVLIGWSVAAFCQGIIIYYPVIWNSGIHPTLLESSAFAGLCRVIWALGIAWIIFACYTGCGGIVNSILSWPGIIPFSRLNYMVYIWHYLVMYVHQANLRENTMVAHPDVAYTFCGHLVFTYLVAFVINMIFESPMMQLEKLILNTSSKQNVEKNANGIAANHEVIAKSRKCKK